MVKSDNLLAIVATALALAVFAATPASAELLRKESPVSVKETLDKFEAVLKGKGLTVFTRVDHAAGAKRVGLELRPTEVIIFGNPNVGTKLMQVEQTMGLTLPLKALAWQDAEGKVWLGYDDPADLAAIRGVPVDHPVIQNVTKALDGLTSAAVK